MKSPLFLWQGLVQAQAQYFLKMLIVKGMRDHCLSVNMVAGGIMSLISRVTTAWTLVSFALHPARELVKFIDILHCLTYGGVMFETVSDTCRGPFLESPDNISGPESCFNVCLVFTRDQSFNNFENDTMKLSKKKK